ncbi:hypothetical protein IQ07DRAFT_640960 [Pyrenochaeta sp. DS3sAY3a]|nr:hypothetical protein IQ07DRAFT_640960 [Pyrenochaeta sp. DS3sAY3a]
MHGRTILLLASLVVPMLAAPTPLVEVVPRDEAVMKRDTGFSLAHVFRDILRREPLPTPSPASLDALVEPRSIELDDDDVDDEEETSVDAVDATEEDSDIESRGLGRGGQGSKRGSSRGGKGSVKRGSSRGGQGSKRGSSRGGKGSKK